MNRRRIPVIALAVVLAVFTLFFAEDFPWQNTWHALRGARWWLLLVAVLINLSSMVAKGWAWHLLLRRRAPHRFRSAQAATFIGGAVNCLSVSVGGEAARIHVLATRDGVDYRAAAGGVLASRVVEGLALAVAVVLASAVLPHKPWVLWLRGVSWTVLAVAVLMWHFQGLKRLEKWLPESVRTWALPDTTATLGEGFAFPLLLGVYNWAAEWATYHLSIVATGIPVGAGASLTVLILSNLGGIPRLTPSNVGVLQAAAIVSLAFFRVDVPHALAAGLVLQAVQTLPTLAVGAVLLGTGALPTLIRGLRPSESSNGGGNDPG